MANNEIEDLMQSAKAHYHAGEYDDAIVDYTKAIVIAPDNMKAEIYLERGRVYKNKGDSGLVTEYDLALDDYKQAFILEPNNEKIVRTATNYSKATVLSRGNAYLEKKDYTSAIVDFKQGIELSTEAFDKAMAEDLLARCYRARDLDADRLLNEEEACDWQVEHHATKSSTSLNGDFEFSNGTIIKYTGSDTEVIIPDTINDQQVTAIGDFAFFGKNMTNVVIPDGIISIGACAFDGNKLTNVVIPGSVTSIKDTAFDYGKLRSVTMPRNVEVGSHVYGFYDCYISHGKKAGVYTLRAGKGWRKSGCYVATAVYGSYDCPQVWTLRRYRDFILAESLFGRAFIHMYYTVSPTVVKWFGNSTFFKTMWRKVLDRKIEDLQKRGIDDTPYEDRDWNLS